MTTSDFTPLCSGQRFTLQTEDPESPLPSVALLDMQWKLNQIVSLSAASEETDLEEDPDDGDVSLVPAFDRGLIENWTQGSSDEDDVAEYYPQKPQMTTVQTGAVESVHVVDQQSSEDQ